MNDERIAKLAADVMVMGVMADAAGHAQGAMFRREAITLIKEFLAGYELIEWYSVDEQLPERHRDVLVIINNRVERGYCFIGSDGTWYWSDNATGTGQPTHWAELPNGPSPGQTQAEYAAEIGELGLGYHGPKK